MTESSSIKRLVLAGMLVLFILPLPVLGFVDYMKPEGDILYVVYPSADLGFKGEIEVWNKSSGFTLIKRIVTNISFSRFDTDGTNFYLGSWDGRVVVLDFDGNLLREIDILKEAKANLSDLVVYDHLVVYDLIFDQDSKLLYTDTEDSIIRVWNMQDDSLVKEVRGHKLPTTNFVLDNNYLYSSSLSVKVWDKQTMELVKTLKMYDYPHDITEETYPRIWEIVVHGQKVYTGHKGGQIKIWDLTTGLLVKEINAHSSDVKGLVTDGQYIYSSGGILSKGVSVKMWTMEGDLIRPVLEPEYSTSELAVDNEYLYVGLFKGGVLVYDKNNWNLTKQLGELSKEALGSVESLASKKGTSNIILPIVIALALFLIIFIILDVYGKVKKKSKKFTMKEVRKVLSSYVKVEDVLKILGVASIIIFILGIFNTQRFFPNYIPGIKLIYYFDVFIRRGTFLPVWFLLLPTLAYWITKKHKKRTRYLVAAVALVIAVVVYILAPQLVWVGTQ